MSNNYIDEIVKLVDADCVKYEDSTGYTLSDGKYHFYIYVDTEADIEDATDNDLFYVIEFNKVVDGCHEPFDACEFADYKNFDQLRESIKFMVNKYAA